MFLVVVEMLWFVKVCLIRGRLEEIVVCVVDRLFLVDWEDVNVFCWVWVVWDCKLLFVLLVGIMELYWWNKKII